MFIVKSLWTSGHFGCILSKLVELLTSVIAALHKSEVVILQKAELLKYLCA